ncbi:hypothetical protein [Actinoallomurus acaciae]|uniref:Lonely Cys domain-containing protein n=1 Tax=Actinoallomurus acaciae TaxID=502577 RepID=A0ABV5Y8W4_9ACTN
MTILNWRKSIRSNGVSACIQLAPGDVSTDDAGNITSFRPPAEPDANAPQILMADTSDAMRKGLEEAIRQRELQAGNTGQDFSTAARTEKLRNALRSYVTTEPVSPAAPPTSGETGSGRGLIPIANLDAVPTASEPVEHPAVTRVPEPVQAAEPTVSGGDTIVETGLVPDPRPGGLPPNLSWTSVRFARSWGMAFALDGPAQDPGHGPPLSAIGAPGSVGGQAVTEPDGLQRENMPSPGGDPGQQLLIVNADGTLQSSRRGTGDDSWPDPSVVFRTVDDAGNPTFTSAAPTEARRPFAGLSAGQVAWAANNGMRFVGPGQDGGRFLEALAAVVRATGIMRPEAGNVDALRLDLIRKVEADGARAVLNLPFASRLLGTTSGTSEGEVAGRGEYGDAPSGILMRLLDAIRGVDGPDEVGELWPHLAHHYLGLPIRAVDADGKEAFSAEAAFVARTNTGAWMGLAPVGPADARGAGTRPADVAGGLSEVLGPDPLKDLPAGAESPPLTGTVLGRPKRSPQLHPVGALSGLDGFLTAVLWAAGGGVSTPEGAYVTEPADLRRELVKRIQHPQRTDLDTWRVVQALYDAAREADGSDRTESSDDRFGTGQALSDIVAALDETRPWPELATAAAPFLLNWFGLAVHEHHPGGVVGRYGTGRPVHIARGGGAAPEWSALVPAHTRYRPTSRLAGPSQADPLLIRLNQAIDDRGRRLLGGGPDPVLGRLRRQREHWLALTTGQEATARPSPRVNDLSRIQNLDSTWLDAWAGADGDRTGLDVGLAVEVVRLLHGAYDGAAITSAGGPVPSGLPGVPAARWVTVTSESDLIIAMPREGMAIFLGEQHAEVIVRTAEALNRVEPDPERPGAARVVPWSWRSGGVALLIDANGATLSAQDLGLGDSVRPAADTVETEGRPVVGPESASVTVSEPQRKRAEGHGARVEPVAPGANAMFEAVIAAGGGTVVVDGAHITDAMSLRRAVADHIRSLPAGSSLLDWPLANAAYRFAGEHRIIEDFFPDTLAQVDQQRLHDQILDHIASGEASRYIAEGFASPDHWPQMVDILGIDAIARALGRDVVVLGSDGQAERHGQAGGPPIVVARITFTGGAGLKPGWGAVVPAGDAASTIESIDAVDVTPVRSAPAGDAPLSEGQRRTAEARALAIRPTLTGPRSFYDAVLATVGGAYLLDNEIVIATPERLRDTLATLVRDRPDVLSEQDRQHIREVVGAVDDDEIRDILRDDEDPRGVEMAKRLIGPYLALDLTVILQNGEITEYGEPVVAHDGAEPAVRRFGQPITLAEPGVHEEVGAAGPHWAAFTATPPPYDVRLHELSDPDDLNETRVIRPWDPRRFRTVVPHEKHRQDDPWRDSSYSHSPDPHVDDYCVSVAVVRLPVRPG